MMQNSSPAYESRMLNMLTAGKEIPEAFRAGCNTALQPWHLGQVCLALFFALINIHKGKGSKPSGCVLDHFGYRYCFHP